MVETASASSPRNLYRIPPQPAARTRGNNPNAIYMSLLTVGRQYLPGTPSLLQIGGPVLGLLPAAVLDIRGGAMVSLGHLTLPDVERVGGIGDIQLSDYFNPTWMLLVLIPGVLNPAHTAEAVL